MFARAKKLVPEPVKNAYHFLQALFGALIFLFPSRKIKVIGVTGTDGKTTTVHLIYHILKEAGKKVSMISTVEARVGDKSIDTGFHVTTPDPIRVQSLLRKMVNARSEYAVLETTSHGLAQERVAFVQFFAGIITNVTHEHLDYHKTYENYLAAKAKLLRGVKFRILNADDPAFEGLKDQGSGQLVSFGLEQQADFIAKRIKLEKQSSEFEIDFTDKQKKNQKIKINLPLVGKYNIYNLLAAFATAVSLEVEPGEIASVITSFKGVPGRMQYIDEGQKFDCVIDFAHTPASLNTALEALNSFKRGKIIAVFGCAGERDKAKRPLMGKIATQLADYSIFTAEDPRGEKVNDIIEQIAKGALEVGGIPNRTFWKIADRAEAINTAIQTLASDGDTVAIFGKGHEQSMSIGGKEFPWSDEAVARNALQLKLKK
jgi:UDP-N-acetylmuramoyl-L-alanyl-D-glutamate--2,6-diaminopimelate ligase